MPDPEGSVIPAAPEGAVERLGREATMVDGVLTPGGGRWRTADGGIVGDDGTEVIYVTGSRGRDGFKLNGGGDVTPSIILPGPSRDGLPGMGSVDTGNVGAGLPGFSRGVGAGSVPGASAAAPGMPSVDLFNLGMTANNNLTGMLTIPNAQPGSPEAAFNTTLGAAAADARRNFQGGVRESRGPTGGEQAYRFGERMANSMPEVQGGAAGGTAGMTSPDPGGMEERPSPPATPRQPRGN